MPLIDTPFKRVAVDLIGPIHPPSEQGHRYILTLVDYATRYPDAAPLKSISTEAVAEALVDMYSRLGVPEEILSDLGTQFVSECMQEVSRLLSIKQLSTTPYHPMCNGLVEKFNGSLKSMLKKLCSEQPKQWHRYINALLFAYREVPQGSTGFSPFELLFGRTVRGPMMILKQLWTEEVEDPEVKTSYAYVFDLRERLEDTVKLAQEELKRSQVRYQRYYNRKAKSRSFKVGSKVLLLLQTDKNKLLLQWKGPFVVESVVGINDYGIRVGDKVKTFHANMLKEYVDRQIIEVKEQDDERGVQGCSVLQVVATAVIERSESGLEEAVDDENLLDLGAIHSKETVENVTFGQQLNGEQKGQLQEVVKKYEHIFTDVPGHANIIEHEVKLTSDKPVRSKPYTIPYNARESLKRDIRDMEKMGVIRESKSPYSSPVVIVRKKDGTNRVCVDFHKLNRITEFDPTPMPTAEDIFQKMSKAKYLTKLDLSKGYWQIPVAAKDIPKTAFVTPDGSYEFVKMPFGMMNSGATLVRAIRKLLEDLDEADNYVDDIIIYTETWEQHLVVLDEVLSRLAKAGFTVRPTKCVLGADSIEVVGHRISDGIKGLHEDNVVKIRHAKRPRTKKEVRAFLGLTEYYREFIPNYAAKAVPLSDLTKKGRPNQVVWSDAQEKAYNTLKAEIASSPILRLPDNTKPFTLRTDASDKGLGAVLLQEHDGKLLPVSYASKKLTEREKKYSTIERECLAVVWAVRKFLIFLYGVEFTLQTDHQPLVYLKTAKFLNDRVMRWAMFLQNYNLKIESIKGVENVGADYLSRAC